MRNSLIQSVRRLQRASGRQEQGQILLEGTHLLQEALRLGVTPELVLATPGWIGHHATLVSRLPAAADLKTCTEEVLAAVATTRHPDGVLLTLPVAALPVPPATPADFVLALDRLQDPGNLGTLLRTALAAGVERVWLGDGADPLQPKVLRASSGAALALPLERLTAAALRARLAAARAGGLQVVAAVVPETGSGAIPYWQLDWRRPTVLLLGNEGGGWIPSSADWRSGTSRSPTVRRWSRSTWRRRRRFCCWSVLARPTADPCPDRGECPDPCSSNR